VAWSVCAYLCVDHDREPYALMNYEPIEMPFRREIRGGQKHALDVGPDLRAKGVLWVNVPDFQTPFKQWRRPVFALTGR